MSRFVKLQRQFRASDKSLAERADYLVLHAEELADDFGLWLSQTESGQTDPLSQAIKVKAVGHYLNDSGEPAYSDALSAGEAGDELNFALEFKLSDGEASRAPNTIRLPLNIVSPGEDVIVTVLETQSIFDYRRSSVPESLFDELYGICEKRLKI